jgi:hypothetical protein
MLIEQFPVTAGIGNALADVGLFVEQNQRIWRDSRFRQFFENGLGSDTAGMG